MSAGLGFVWIPFIIATAVTAGSTAGPLWIGANRIKNGQKLAASNFANEAEQYLQQNVDAWNSLPANEKTTANRGAAMEIFYYWWSELTNKCATLGEAGQRCINERNRGGQNSWGKDWFELYLDPIEKSPVVDGGGGSGGGVATTTTTANTNAGTSVTPGANPVINLGGDMGGINPMLLLAGLGVAYLATRK